MNNEAHINYKSQLSWLKKKIKTVTVGGRRSCTFPPPTSNQSFLLAVWKISGKVNKQTLKQESPMEFTLLLPTADSVIIHCHNCGFCERKSFKVEHLLKGRLCPALFTSAILKVQTSVHFPPGGRLLCGCLHVRLKTNAHQTVCYGGPGVQILLPIHLLTSFYQYFLEFSITYL